MVVLHVKRADGGDGFLYETSCGTSNDALIRELAWVYNARVKLKVLVPALRDLAKHGPVIAPEDGARVSTGSGSGGGGDADEARVALADASLTEGGPSTTASTSTKAATSSNTAIATSGGEESQASAGDGGGMERSDVPPEDPRAVETLERVAADIEAYVAKEQVERKVAMRRDVLKEKLDNARGVVAMAYPMGLSAHDPAWRVLNAGRAFGQGTEAPPEGRDHDGVSDHDHHRQHLHEQQQQQQQDDDEDVPAAIAALQGMPLASELLDPATAELWAMGRAFDRGQTVGERLGTRNEKTKVVAKLQRPDQGPPPREPIVSEAERQAMMAFYFKRQEEMKRLAEANDDDYLRSAWADGKSLQRNLRGVADVKAPGLLPSSSSSSSSFSR